MEYKTSVQMKLPTFVSCKDCKLWFPVDSSHNCLRNIDTAVYDYNIHWNF
jgi:hypothetical protein